MSLTAAADGGAAADEADAQLGKRRDDEHGLPPGEVVAEKTSRPGMPGSGTIDDEDQRHSTIGLDHAEEDSYPAAPSEHLLPPPPPPDFKPFFVLVEDPLTGQQHHPHVHYVFADDDTDVLTAAALEAIEPSEGTDATEQERFVVVDLGADGKTVQAATSWSEDWQAVTAKVEQAPSLGNTVEGGADRGLMLKISGREVSKQVVGGSRRAGDMDSLMKTFGERMSGLEDVLGEDGRLQPPTGAATAPVGSVTRYEDTTHDEIDGTG